MQEAVRNINHSVCSYRFPIEILKTIIVLNTSLPQPKSVTQANMKSHPI